MLEFFCISKSTYFYNVKNYNFPKKDVDLENKITEIFNYHKSRYGYRRITLSLKNENILVNHKKVKRIMKELGLFAKNQKLNISHIKVNLVRQLKIIY
ncbi:Transposase, orfB [Alteracholeplasma palmae J233]|uniref:Transposase, orfB n=2 Tax=Acholeplasma palmae TaxID=38986 RepID=U4KK48_ALTPJ|nr:Transposase, orfB [Alteracholeplasma palmae J233]